MSIQILPSDSTAAAGIGSGVGQGLAQQLPEEIKRYRLASGLKNLGNQSQKGTAFENLAALSAIPGMEPGLLGVLAPLLQQQQQRQEVLSDNKTGISNVQQTQTNVPNQQETREPATNLSRRENREGYLQQASENEISKRANELLRNRPYSFPTEDLARSRASEELNREYQADVSYQQRIDLLEKDFDEAHKSYLQKDKSLQEGEIGGQVRTMLLNQAKDEIASSKQSPRKIAEKYAQKALEIAKEKQSMRRVYGDWNKAFPPSSKEIDSLRSIEKVYKKNGIPSDVFIDDLTSTQNISRGAASYIANPLTNTAAGKFLRSLPENRGFEGIKRTFTNQEAKLAKQLVDKNLIKPEDLMGSVAYIAEQKGFDGNKLLGELQKLLPDDKITEAQGRDLRTKQIPTFRTLDERWLMGFSGERKKAAK